jgi:hypothetical protein
MRVSILLVVRTGVMFPKELVGDQVIFSETLVVSMPVPATVGAPLGLERGGFLAHRHTELNEHFAQDWIGLKLEKIFAELYRRVAVSQVVRGTHQGIRRLGGHEKDIFRGRFDPDQRSVFGLQKVAVAQDGSARQEQGRFRSIRERRSKPALAPKIEWQHKLGERTQFSFVDCAFGVFFDPYWVRHLRKEIGRVQNRKYRCAMGKIFAGSQVSNSPSATTW